MSSKPVYRLGDSTVIEPLVNRWQAWLNTLSPVTYSLHLRNYQIKLLQSYLSDPRPHADAYSKPKMRSGSFVGIPEARAAEVKQLLERTQTDQADNLRFAKEIIDFGNYLVEEAVGQSLDPYYAKMPDSLKGYAELVYDYYNRPTVRLFENLLYQSPYYRSDLQSFRLFEHKRDDARPFIMNTPRLPEPDCLDWQTPFDSPEADDLFKLDCQPQPLERISEMLRLTRADDQRLLRLLSEGAAPACEKWDGPTARIRYFGHACVLVEWKGVSILTDPYISATPSEGGAERLTYRDLPEKIDYVIITHNHHDHFCLESLLRLRHRIECLVVPRSFGFVSGDPSLKLLAKRIGFKKVIDLDALESIELPDGEIISIPFMGEHGDLPHGKTAYVIRAGTEQALFAADSDCLDTRMYRHIRRVIGPIDTVFLGMECVGAPLSWSCGPFFPFAPAPEHERTRRYKGCDSVRGMKLLEAVGAERIYIYAMGMEPWFEHLLGLAYTEDAKQIIESNKLLAEARERGFSVAERLFGKCDIHLPDAHSGQLTSRKRVEYAEPNTELQPDCNVYAGSVTGGSSLADAEDQFIFD